jgi:hypothetical protein
MILGTPGIFLLEREVVSENDLTEEWKMLYPGAVLQNLVTELWHLFSTKPVGCMVYTG